MSDAPHGFICESCGRTSYSMGHAPRCHRCRRAAMATSKVPEWVENAMAARWLETKGAVAAFTADPTEATFRTALSAMKAYGKLRSWL